MGEWFDVRFLADNGPFSILLLFPVADCLGNLLGYCGGMVEPRPFVPPLLRQLDPMDFRHRPSMMMMTNCSPPSFDDYCANFGAKIAKKCLLFDDLNANFPPLPLQCLLLANELMAQIGNEFDEANGMAVDNFRLVMMNFLQPTMGNEDLMEAKDLGMNAFLYYFCCFWAIQRGEYLMMWGKMDGAVMIKIEANYGIFREICWSNLMKFIAQKFINADRINKEKYLFVHNLSCRNVFNFWGHISRP
jgi:hypothetical protein